MVKHFEHMKRQASFGTGPLTIKDRYGREITEGCEILIDHAQSGGVMIQSIAPVLDLKAPPGVVRVRAFIHFDFMVKAGEPQPQFLLVRTVADLVAAGVLRPQPPPSVEAPTEETYVDTAGNPIEPLAERPDLHTLNGRMEPEGVIPPPASGSKVEPLIFGPSTSKDHQR